MGVRILPWTRFFCNVHLFRVPLSWTGSVQMKSSMTFIQGNRCIQREKDILKFDREVKRFKGVRTSFKADMKSYIPLENDSHIFLANLFLKQSISSEYVMVDFIYLGKLRLQGAKTENYKMKNSCP